MKQRWLHIYKVITICSLVFLLGVPKLTLAAGADAALSNPNMITNPGGFGEVGGGGLPVADFGASISRALSSIGEFLSTTGKRVANVTVRTALNTFLSRLAYDTATWMAYGFNGQEAGVFQESGGEYILKIGDATLGSAIQGFATATGLNAAGLCDPGADFRISLTLGLETNFGQAQSPDQFKPACTLTELGKNWKKAYADPDFNKFFEAHFDPTANPLGIALEVSELTLSKKIEAQKEAELKRLNSDFKDQVALISKTIVTPGSVVEQIYKNNVTDAKTSMLYQMTEEPAVNAVNIFATTLITKLVERIKAGMVPDVANNLSSLMSVGSSTGRQAAEEMYADLKNPTFYSTGEYDITAELAVCPITADVKPTVNNCAMGIKMQQAIQQQLTVKEFVDSLNGAPLSFVDNTLEGNSISNDAGFTEKGVILLKKYRIVPVGWQLAAEYSQYRLKINGTENNNNNNNTCYQAAIPTLQQIMNCYDACGGAEEGRDCQLLMSNNTECSTYSPYCKLIDPDWVLLAPQNYCEREAPGPDYASIIPVDDDANLATQQVVAAGRLNYCADNRGCIAAGDDGNCLAYGYCTQEKRSYQFAGKSCDTEHASCQTFTDTQGNTVSYLKNSLNYGDCATDPGCKWYCASTDEAGKFDCASSGSTYLACNEANAAANNFSMAPSASCSCNWQKTCQVAAGSERGTDTNADGVYDYWQCVINDTEGQPLSVCSLSDTCGKNNPSYNEVNGVGTCTCTAQQSCTVEDGDTECPIDLQYNNTATTTACQLDTTQAGGVCGADYPTYSATTACEAKDTVGMNCDCAIAVGAYSCTNSNGSTCIIGTTPETPAVENDTLYFNNTIKTCASEDAGCRRYLRVLPDTNLLPNAYFDYKSGGGENERTLLGFCSDTGQGCTTASNCSVGSVCQGWQQNNLTAQVFENAETDINANYVQLITEADGSAFTNTVDTGYDLSDRTFTFAYRARVTNAVDCEANYSIGSSNQVYNTTTAVYNSVWTDYSLTVSFPASNVNDSKVQVAINGQPGCALDIEAAQLAETDSFSDSYSNYGNNATYLNEQVISCSAEDVGCEMYTEAGNKTNQIPGLITNPQAIDTCVLKNADGTLGYDYGNPACSQCNGDTTIGQTDDYNVGCDFYQEAPLTNNAPLVASSSNINSLDEKSKTGAIQRTGYYCSGDNSTHCFDDSQCAGKGSCMPLLSIVPASAKQCSVAQVGCEEYTNLAAVAEGGEGLEYYNRLQQCVKTSDNNIATYYTFVGSNSGGVQVEDYLLKKSNVAGGGPCTHLDLLSQESNANCVDNADATLTIQDCGPNGNVADNMKYGVNPDCRQFIDDDDTGTVYYRYESQTVVASDNCTPLRNSLDERTYYALKASSSACGTAAVGCREYQGSNASATEDIITEDFADNSFEGWSGAVATANDSVIQGDYSLQMHGATNNTITYVIKEPALEAGKAYVLKFWAKVTQPGTATFSLIGLDNTYYFTTNGVTTDSAQANVQLDPQQAGGWQYYQLGPIILDSSASIDGDEAFVIQYGGAEAYIDTITLASSNSQYLVQDSARLCQKFEGCREYNDRANNTYYLKSFKRLCNDTAVGCEAMLDTSNSSNPFTEGFVLNNEYTQDDTIVSADKPVTLVYDTNQQCSQTAYGCTAFGLPDIDERTNEINGYSSVYLYDRPDEYATSLCEEAQLACEQYTSDYDGTAYFKNPGDKTCTLRDYKNYEGADILGWFKNRTDEDYPDYPDCPVQYNINTEAYASQPLNGVCNSNSITSTVNKIGALCNTDADCYPTDWNSGLPKPRCISSISEDVDEYLKDSITLKDIRSDFGWAGECPNEQSGCTEYVDPYSPNQAELVSNYSFEYDTHDSTGDWYSDEDVPNGYPDNWISPAILDINGDGQCDSNCTAKDYEVLMTTAADYTGEAINAGTGAAALYLMNAGIVNNGDLTKLSAENSYTLQALVRLPAASFDDVSLDTDNPAKFSIGLMYWAADVPLYVSTAQTYVTADHVTIPKESNTKQTEEWYRLEGNIGLGSTVTLPTDGCDKANSFNADDCATNKGTWKAITTIKVFVINHSTAPMYVDDVSLKQNDHYYYLDYTVDGTAEHAQNNGVNTCTEVSAGAGCVAFRDATTETQTQAQDGLACATCMLTPTSDTCRTVLDACDTNTILKVKNQRVCSEWLACETGYVYTDSNDTTQNECLNIRGCTKMDDNGNCIKWSDKPSSTELNSAADIGFVSDPGQTDGLQAAQNLTGYTKAGLIWTQERSCNTASDLPGKYCNEDINCLNPGSNNPAAKCNEPFSVMGYYPYGWMYEVANNGTNSKDLIEFSTFEDLYCVGDDANPKRACLHNATNEEDYATSQCYENSIGVLYTDQDPGNDPVSYTEDNTADPADIDATYYCPNNAAFEAWPFRAGKTTTTKTGWSGIGKSLVKVKQYDKSLDCLNDCDEIDANNVLAFTPALTSYTTSTGGTANKAFSGGAQYDLNETINPSATYALSFAGRYTSDNYVPIADNNANPSAMSVCFNYSNVATPSGDAVNSLRDCFVNGYGSADIVFAIDTSSSMTEEIMAVNKAIPALVKELDNAGVSAKFSFVSIGLEPSYDSDGNYLGYKDAIQDVVLDSTDNITDITALFKNLNCCSTSGSTPDKCIENNGVWTDYPFCIGYGVLDPWEAIIETANNEFYQADDSVEHINFRNGASRFLILVTDQNDGQLPGDDNNEVNAITAAASVPMPVYVITSDVASNDTENNIFSSGYYAGIASATGGETYTFTVNGTTSTDWVNDTDIVSDVASNVAYQSEKFQLTTDLKNYSFGPLTLTNMKKIGADNSGYVLANKEIGIITSLQFLGSDGTEIAVDNVSLLPVLEVNRDLSPIARSCRAYPDSDAKQCSYQAANGNQYRGWQGYCLELDPSNTQRCLTWWPLDVIAGEASLMKEPTSVITRSNVYHCLVAKGYEKPGFCVSNDAKNGASSAVGTGVACSDTADCNMALLGTPDPLSGAHTCFIGEHLSVNDYNNNDINGGGWYKFDSLAAGTSDSEKQKFSGAYHSRVAEWDMPNEADNLYQGNIAAIIANPLLKNIHVSEIETIEFNPGSAGDGTGAQNEFPYWGQLDGGKNSTEGYNRHALEVYDREENDQDTITGNIWLTDLYNGAIKYDADGKVDPLNQYCYAYDAAGSSSPYGIGCGVWGAFDNNKGITTNYDYYKQQYNPNNKTSTPNGYDLVYTWAYSNFNTNVAGCKKSAGSDANASAELYWEILRAEGSAGSWLTSSCVDNAVKCIMGVGDCAEDNNPWKHMGTVFDSGELYGGIKGGSIDQNRNIWDDFSYIELDTTWPGWTQMKDDLENKDVGNVFSLYIDFNDNGYVEKIYPFFYYAAEKTSDGVAGITLTYDAPMYINFYLRESCALLANTVGNDGTHHAWSNRLSGTDPYNIFAGSDGTMADTLKTSYKPFGSVAPLEGTPDTWDTFETVEKNTTTNTTTSNVYQYNTYGNQPPISYNIATGTENSKIATAGQPISCIGTCSQQWCVGNPMRYNTPCIIDDECKSEKNGKTFVGKCMGVTNSATSNIIGNKGMYANNNHLINSYQQAVAASANVAVGYLRRVFADVIGDFYRLDPVAEDQYSETGNIYLNAGDNYWVDLENGNNVFDAMSVCDTDDGSRPVENEYCGVKPVVDNIKLELNTTADGKYYQFPTGTNVKFSFDVQADVNQEPIPFVYVDYGDKTDSVTFPWEGRSATFPFTHVYECKANTLGSHCEYIIKVVAVDNWNWCSGTDNSKKSSGVNRYDSSIDGDVFEQCGSETIMPVTVWVDKKIN
ncbi:MAG: hypothetical protein WCW27_01385 [Patescibacteria group bacterium]|jgi:hypothetical protein